MTELKTLEDLSINIEGLQFAGISVVRYDDLRKEAIKWIKEDIKVAQSQEMGVDTKMLSACMKWVHRFNITREELGASYIKCKTGSCLRKQSRHEE